MTRNHTLLALFAASLLGLAACDGTSPRGVAQAPMDDMDMDDGMDVDDGMDMDDDDVVMEPTNFDALVLRLINEETNGTAEPVAVNDLDFEFLAQPNDEPTLQDQI